MWKMWGLVLLATLSVITICGAKNPICLLPRWNLCSYPGLPKLRYYYNRDEEQCIQFFFFSNCTGNANNFLTLEDCESSCPYIINTTQSPLQTTRSVVTTSMESTVQESTPADTVQESTPAGTVQESTPAGTVQESTVATEGMEKEVITRAVNKQHLMHTTEIEKEFLSERDLSIYDYISISIGILVLILVVVSIGVTVAVGWRIWRLHLHGTKIMNKDEPVVLTYFEMATISQQSKMMEAKSELPSTDIL